MFQWDLLRRQQEALTSECSSGIFWEDNKKHWLANVPVGSFEKAKRSFDKLHHIKKSSNRITKLYVYFKLLIFHQVCFERAIEILDSWFLTTRGIYNACWYLAYSCLSHPMLSLSHPHIAAVMNHRERKCNFALLFLHPPDHSFCFLFIDIFLYFQV